ncbi:MAG: DUF4838 domain-containing protein [Planctomycetes bacterium]|nr:DUF4838 domain-containing protein [Planctomycetota bacterium]
MTRARRLLGAALLVLPACTAPVGALNPVKFNRPLSHPPVPLVEQGAARATICVMGGKDDRVLAQAVKELQDCIEAATGAKLPVVQDRVQIPALVIGNCPEAADEGLVGARMPVEGFTIRTNAGRVFIVGHDGPVGPKDTRAVSHGTAWGVFEFLERFVGVRWYWPTERGGRSVPKAASLVVQPVWLEDAPVFRKREIWPPMANAWNGTGQQLGPLYNCLRAGNSWPINLVVHSPNWSGVKEYTEGRPECFQLGSDGSRNFQMLCYGNPKALETYLENIAAHFDQGKKAHMGIVGDAVTVSPNDAGIACYCADCRRLWNERGGQYGTASRVLATFVEKLALAVKARWPDKTIVYLPYLNYTLAPEGIRFPDNVEVQLCGMPGIAQYKEPSILAAEQANVDRWAAITGRKIQNWHYSCWPEDKTKAPYHYPHVLKAYYQANRDKLVGSFINGDGDHFPRQHISLYCWMKLLWDPDFDVDAAMEEFCDRMFGRAAPSIRRLLRLQVDGWEKSRWPGGILSPKAIYAFSYPPKTVEQMKQLLARARAEAAGDPLATQRVEYYATPFADFFEEFETVVEGKGARPLIVQKVSENPVISGKLDEELWKLAPEVQFYKHENKREVLPKYPTTLRAVWTQDGVTFGFWMAEPSPQTLVQTVKSRDESMAWWNDCVEIFLDVTGKNQGQWYQWIINPHGVIHDGKGQDTSWNPEGVRARSHIGKDFWSVEVFIPYSIFPEALRPGTNVVWYGQFTRHRMSDGGKAPGSIQENQKMNCKFGGFNSNLADFAPVKFVE